MDLSALPHPPPTHRIHRVVGIHSTPSLDQTHTTRQVQSGGNFDVDYSVTDPLGKVLLSGEKERQGDFVYTVQTVGEHTHCIFNTMSTYTAKLVDIELTAQDDKFSVSAKLPQAKSIADEHISPLEESLYKISADLSQIARNQKYFRTRENRNFATVQSTESRIFWFSFLENALIVGMSALQVCSARRDSVYVVADGIVGICGSNVLLLGHEVSHLSTCVRGIHKE